MALERWLWTRFLILLALLLYAEFIARALEIYPIERFLPTHQNKTFEETRTPSLLLKRVIEYAKTRPIMAGVNFNWIRESPPPQTDPPPISAERKALYKRAVSISPGLYSRAVFTYNLNFLKKDVCHNGPHKGILKDWPGPFYVFETSDGRVDPIYRLPLYRRLPMGGHSNSFGWKGPEIPLNKPPGTIRLGFVGDSTTHGHFGGWSYSEYIGHWLNLWAKANNYSFNFDVFNAARLAQSSQAIANSISEEVVQLEPDIVVYYAGGGELGMNRHVKIPNDINYDAAAAKKSELARLALDLPVSDDAPSMLNMHSSALVRRSIAQFSKAHGEGLREVRKPRLEFVLPEGLNEYDPDITSEALPDYLRKYQKNIQTIKIELDKIGALLVTTSYIWVVKPDLILDPRHDRGMWDHLNRWAYSYDHFRRTADLNNRVFKNVADNLGIEFIDIASKMPLDPSLFTDPAHDFGHGTRLKAWLIMQDLIPIILAQVEQGILSRPDRQNLSTHPNIHPDRLIADPCK